MYVREELLYDIHTFVVIYIFIAFAFKREHFK